MDNREQFTELFYLLHPTASMNSAQRAHITRLRVVLEHFYMRWEKLMELRQEDCLSALRKKILQAEIEQIEAAYMQARSNAEAVLAEPETRIVSPKPEDAQPADADESALRICRDRLARLNEMAACAAVPMAAAEDALQLALRLQNEAAPRETLVLNLQMQLQRMYCEICAHFRIFNALTEPLEFPGIPLPLRPFIDDTAAAIEESAESAQRLIESLETQLRDIKAYLDSVEADQKKHLQWQAALMEKLQKRAAED